MSDDFYRAFEEKYRGSRELVKQRLTVYLPFVTPLLTHYPTASVLDLGCGRGEWLELLSEAGFNAHGVDLDENMLSACHEKGLSVEKSDALTVLKLTADASLTVISAFHLVEHLTFEQIRELVQQALRALVPGGLLILETPNPENIVVATHTFHLDPTHQKPLPPRLLSFVVEHAGFERTKTLRLQEAPEVLDTDQQLSLISVLEGASPDYAIIGQKNAAPTVLESFSTTFDQEFGISLHALAERHQHQHTTLLNDIINKLRQAEATAHNAEVTAQQAEATAHNAEVTAQQTNVASKDALTQLNAVLVSKSWRLTAPLRTCAQQVRLLHEYGFRSRSKSFIKKTIRYLTAKIHANPLLKKVIDRSAARLGIRTWLRELNRKAHNSAKHTHEVENLPTDLQQLTPHARRIYAQLKSTIEEKHKGQRQCE
jgi:SAM-dependent methyltransferase